VFVYDHRRVFFMLCSHISTKSYIDFWHFSFGIRIFFEFFCFHRSQKKTCGQYPANFEFIIEIVKFFNVLQWR